MQGRKIFVATLGLALIAFGGISSADTIVCDVSDVTFGVSGTTAQDSDQCYWGNTSPSDGELPSVAGTAFGIEADNPWTFVLKDDGGSGNGTFAGLVFTLNAENDVNDGSWTLSWTDPDPVSLPALLDFAVVLKAGQGSGAYLFDDVELPFGSTSGTGEFLIRWSPNTQGISPALSNMAIVMRGGEPPLAPGVPIPAPLALLGLGGLMLGWQARKARS